MGDQESEVPCLLGLCYLSDCSTQRLGLSPDILRTNSQHGPVQDTHCACECFRWSSLGPVSCSQYQGIPCLLGPSFSVPHSQGGQESLSQGVSANGHLPTFPAHRLATLNVSSTPPPPAVLPPGSATCCSLDLKASQAPGRNPLVHRSCSPGTLSIFCFLLGATQVQHHGQGGREAGKAMNLGFQT